MRTLKDLKENIEQILKEYPEWENLPLIYSADPEGNHFSFVNFEMAPLQVHSLNDDFAKLDYIEVVGFFDDTNPNDDERDISEKDVNCICIN